MVKRVYSDGTTRVTINTDGLEMVREALSGDSRTIVEALGKVGSEFLKHFQKNFDGKSWEPLAETTKKRKAKAGYSPDEILKATGQIFNALDPNNRKAPGQVFIISTHGKSGPSITVGYGGKSKYIEGDPKYAKAFTFGGGTIATLAQIHQTGAYNKGVSREMITSPDSSVVNKVNDIMTKAITKVINKANKLS